MRKQNSKNQKYDQTSELLRVEVPSFAMHDKCCSEDSIGDTENSAHCDVQKIFA